MAVTFMGSICGDIPTLGGTNVFTWLALQSSVVHRQAMMLDPGVSEMSCGSHRFLGRSGLLIGPSKMDSEKHSRMMLVSSLNELRRVSQAVPQTTFRFSHRPWTFPTRTTGTPRRPRSASAWRRLWRRRRSSRRRRRRRRGTRTGDTALKAGQRLDGLSDTELCRRTPDLLCRRPLRSAVAAASASSSSCAGASSRRSRSARRGRCRSRRCRCTP